ALPLAAEPVTAALDLVIEFVSSQFSRDATLALLSSPHVLFGGERISRAAIAKLDEAMLDARYMGELDRLRAIADDVRNDASAAAVAAAEELLPLLSTASASWQLKLLTTFFTAHASDNSSTGAGQADDRARRGRSAVVDVLQRLASAYAAHGDREATIDDLAPDIRRWIEEGTFVPETSRHGIHLLDASAAPFGEFDDVTLVGLVEGEWPERTRRNIFYAPSVLGALGWPSERDRRSAATANFLNLINLASRHLVMSTFMLDDEALVEPSTLIEDAAALPLTRVETPVPAVELESPETDAPDWAALRARRTPSTDARYHGATGSYSP